MTGVEKELAAYLDLTPNHAKEPLLRPHLEESLKSQLMSDIPAMVSRLAELEPIITLEVGEYIDFLMEAKLAFQYGLWRGVVALVGVASEGFSDNLYKQIGRVKSVDGEEITRETIFGRDDYVPEQRKLAVLRLFGLISKESHENLTRIKKLRDLYIHPQPKGRDCGEDAREAMKLFRAVLKERFNSKYTIKKGKVVERQREDSSHGPL